MSATLVPLSTRGWSEVMPDNGVTSATSVSIRVSCCNATSPARSDRCVIFVRSSARRCSPVSDRSADRSRTGVLVNRSCSSRVADSSPPRVSTAVSVRSSSRASAKRWEHGSQPVTLHP